VTSTLAGTAAALPSIDTLDDLRQHLQWAIELEHATLPPYLCALYSLDPTSNADASEVLTGVLVEEMLHLGLAANILNAVGGRPSLDDPALLQPYPRLLPHCGGSIRLTLEPFGEHALENFLAIEKPASPTAPAEADGYETIGQFYTAVEDGLVRLCAGMGERAVFAGDPARQVFAARFRYSSGRLIAVDGLTSALAALGEIVDQGEGIGRNQVWDGCKDVFHPGHAEVSHYYRFQELQRGRRFQPGDTLQTGPTGEAISVNFDDVLPMRRDPRLSDHLAGHPIRRAQHEFNVSYCTLLEKLEQAFNASPERIDDAIGTMYALKAKAQTLMQTPDGRDHVAGPTFDYVRPGLRQLRLAD
jgi:hypothetical protein